MTGFIVTCEERSYIKNSTSCDTFVKFNVSDFEWPDDPRVLQAKLFEEIRLAARKVHICSEKVTKFCEIFTLLLTGTT